MNGATWCKSTDYSLQQRFKIIYFLWVPGTHRPWSLWVPEHWEWVPSLMFLFIWNLVSSWWVSFRVLMGRWCKWFRNPCFRWKSWFLPKFFCLCLMQHLLSIHPGYHVINYLVEAQWHYLRSHQDLWYKEFLAYIPFVQCQSAFPFLRHSYFKIWPFFWKSVNAMHVVNAI